MPVTVDKDAAGQDVKFAVRVFAIGASARALGFDWCLARAHVGGVRIDTHTALTCLQRIELR